MKKKEHQPTSTLLCVHFGILNFYLRRTKLKRTAQGKIIDVSSCRRLAKKGKLEISVYNFTSHRQEEFPNYLFVCISSCQFYRLFERNECFMKWIYNRDLEMLHSKKSCYPKIIFWSMPYSCICDTHTVKRLKSLIEQCQFLNHCIGICTPQQR